jgi:hypothetical protein
MRTFAFRRLETAAPSKNDRRSFFFGWLLRDESVIRPHRTLANFDPDVPSLFPCTRDRTAL